jgi:hypothetical protein
MRRCEYERMSIREKEADLHVLKQELDGLALVRIEAEERMEERGRALEAREQGIMSKLEECAQAESAAEEAHFAVRDQERELEARRKEITREQLILQVRSNQFKFDWRKKQNLRFTRI